MSNDPPSDRDAEAENPEPQLRLADTATRTRELVAVNQSLALVRLRLVQHLEDLRGQSSLLPLSVPKQKNPLRRLRKVIKGLMGMESSQEFYNTYNSQAHFEREGAKELEAFEWKHRYGVHLLGALKALLEIREDFIAAEMHDNLDYQCVEQLSPTNKWVTCWVLLRGCKGKEPRTPMGQGYSTNPVMCILEATIGRILHTRGVSEREMEAWKDGRVGKAPASYRETTSHRCHQNLCCKPSHLINESWQDNFARNYCPALGDCSHMPERCLLPYHSSRLKPYSFIASLIMRRQDPTGTKTPRNIHRRKHPGQQAGQSTAKHERGKKPNAWRKKYIHNRELLAKHRGAILQAEMDNKENGERPAAPAVEDESVALPQCLSRKRTREPSPHDEDDEEL